MRHDVIMPALGMAQDSGVIVAWHKAAGDAVAKGDVLFEVETDKATMEVEAQADGFLNGVRAQAGEEVPVGNVIAVIGDGSFGFTALEVDTAVRHGAKAVFVVVNNEAWNIERHDQIDRFDNVVGVELPGCRYDLLGRSLGAHGERVEDPDKLEAAIAAALDAVNKGRSAILDVVVG